MRGKPREQGKRRGKEERGILPYLPSPRLCPLTKEKKVKGRGEGKRREKEKGKSGH